VRAPPRWSQERVRPPKTVSKVVELPDAIACALGTAQWHGTTAKTDLRARLGGPVFARARTGKASLHLPVGSTTDGAVLEIADSALAVRGHVAAEAIALHPGKPFVLADAGIPLGQAGRRERHLRSARGRALPRRLPGRRDRGGRAHHLGRQSAARCRRRSFVESDAVASDGRNRRERRTRTGV